MIERVILTLATENEHFTNKTHQQVSCVQIYYRWCVWHSIQFHLVLLRPIAVCQVHNMSWCHMLPVSTYILSSSVCKAVFHKSRCKCYAMR